MDSEKGRCCQFMKDTHTHNMVNKDKTVALQQSPSKPQTPNLLDNEITTKLMSSGANIMRPLVRLSCWTIMHIWIVNNIYCVSATLSHIKVMKYVFSTLIYYRTS